MKDESIMVPPHSIEVEQSLLRAVMLDDDVWDRIADKIIPDDFYRREHREIFQAMQKLYDEGVSQDVVAVLDQLESTGKLEDAGGMTYASEVYKGTGSPANAEHYVEKVREYSEQRKFLQACEKAREECYGQNGKDLAEIKSKLEESLFSLGSSATDLVNASEVLEAVIKHKGDVGSGKEKITTVPTGYIDIDRIIGGLRPKSLYIVAGQPSMGKTALVMNIAEHIAFGQQIPVAVFSMEMGKEQIVDRLLASGSRIDFEKISDVNLSQDDWSALIPTLAKIDKGKLYIDDSATLSPTDLRAKARRADRKLGKLGLIVVDYLQYMHIPGSRAEQRVAEVTKISRALKALAKELSVPVIAVSQLNRGMAQRVDKRPVMSDLRDSGSIEQDADAILFVYRDEVHNRQTDNKGVAEIIVSKNRHGPTGIAELSAQLDIMRFENLANQYNSGMK